MPALALKNVEYRSSSLVNDIALLCEDCIDAKLFVTNWSMFRYYSNFKAFGVEQIAVVYVDGMLVGCALRRRSPETTGRHIAVFIHEDYRRQGHGTELVKMLSTNKKTKYVYLNGIEGSSAFFKAQNMTHMYNDDPEDDYDRAI